MRAFEQLRADGHAVYVHCVEAHSRTSAIVALYGAREQRVSVEQALNDVRRVLPEAYPNSDFRAALRRLEQTR